MNLRTILAAVLLATSSVAGWAAGPDPLDWPTWRGPEQNGVSREKNLPDRWSQKGENLVWRRQELATRSTPIVLEGRLYTICRAFPESTQEGEKIVCANIETGETIWERANNVFLSDSPAERVGWSSVVGDPASGLIYALGLGCYFQCLEAKTGNVAWSRSLSEEYGMLSTYGGRTNFPIVFEDLVIVSGVMTGWGDYAVPAHRFIAFDKKTGDAVWIASTRLRPEDTTYCTPVITAFNGEKAMVFGAGDGSIYALQPRTGAMIWKYDASSRGVNTMPVVADGIVYCGHSEQNASNTSILGAVFAFDGRTRGDIPENKLLWKHPARTVGRSQPMVIDGRLYAIEDGGTLWINDAQTGTEIGKQKLGRIMFGSMVYGDGKLYAGEATGRCYILQPDERGVKIVHQERLNNHEILGSPIISHGRIFLPTSEAMYCIGKKDLQPSADPIPEPPAERSLKSDPKITQIQVVPVEAMIKPGEKLSLKVRGFNASGQFVKQVEATFSVAGPGQVDGMGHYSAAQDTGHAAAIITAEAEGIKASSRVRVIPPLPWSFDFSDEKVPLPWIGAAYRHQPRKIEGDSALVKISTIPKGTRSQSWMGWTDLHDYTVQADFFPTRKNDDKPDLGLINQRYTLALMASNELQIRSWTSRLELRFAKTIPFEWEPGKWYTMKFQSATGDGRATLRGKIWVRGDQEPAAWTIEAADETPNLTGSPGLFGNATNAELIVDNVKVYANK